MSNNRFTSGQGYAYDSAGNVITDALGRTFAFDAENKQKEVRDVNNIVIGTYFYDGDGKRVKKVSNTETVIFVYDAQGKLVAEYANQTPVNPQVSYLTQDNLGSPRITTDANGNVISRRDFHPFGEEVFTTQRIAGLGYAADNVKQKFTGYIRDDETDLDFAQARYFNSGFGRFSSPDDFLNDTKPDDPQSWNLYVYVRNNPLRYIDPDGQIKKDKNGNVIFDKKDDVNVTFYTQPLLDKNGKQIGTLSITWKAERGNIYADDGTKIEAFKNGKMEAKAVDSKGNILTAETQAAQGDLAKLEAAGYNNTTDCHGNTFANGQVWINNDQVDKLVKGDGYDTKNPTSTPKAGDVGIYTTNGNLKNTVHSVLVNTVESKTNAVVDVISKGGITPKVITAPGPGKNTGWNDPNVKLQYYTKRTNPSKP